MSTMAATAHSSPPAAGPRPGLRERKKMKTRATIREATYRLIQEQGYDATTVEQIAEAAEVSPSTVFRYFPSKEDIVLTDEYDPVLEEELRARPADEPWSDSLRHVLRKAIGLGNTEEPEVTRLRTRLMVDVPAVRSRMMENMSVTGRLLCRAIGERLGRDPDSLEVRVFAMSLIGGLLETSLYWAEGGHREDLAEVVDRAVDVLEHGLTAKNPEATGAPRMTS
ncbi:TetR/AcrR family transcriptional regulator [Streptomyces sp. NPDC058274]|uniref:TetR/AcrR family transcriptional regulator n=1 Tax=Streptomyces sp. NPDC058274 TaxID=3346416 RepID=UPI0036E4A3B3